MSYFSEWEQITNKTLELISASSDLLKLVYNNSPDPLSESTPIWSDVFMKNIFPIPKDAKSVSNQKTIVNVYVQSAYPYDKNPRFREDYLCIEVGCHLETWVLDNGRIRPYIICNIIDEILDQKQISVISMRKLLNIGVKILRFGDQFFGYRIMYSLSNPNTSTCND